MFFHPAKGIIALDIDGTVTAQSHEIEFKVIDALEQFTKEGWFLIFITGRPFHWGFLTLKSLPFSYTLAVQNGALLIEMPSRNILNRKYLTHEILPELERICQECETDFVVYSGLENDDWCYYRSAVLPDPMQTYGLRRAAFLGEKWRSLQTFSDLPMTDFSAVKIFAKDRQALMISERIEKELGLHAPPIRDPYSPDFFVIQATHPQANKGFILKEFVQKMKISGPIIAAGDDHNDRSMLQAAHVKIAMANAPPDLLAMADVIAPPASQLGIIQGLNEAIEHVKGKIYE